MSVSSASFDNFLCCCFWKTAQSLGYRGLRADMQRGKKRAKEEGKDHEGKKRLFHEEERSLQLLSACKIFP